MEDIEKSSKLDSNLKKVPEQSVLDENCFRMTDLTSGDILIITSLVFKSHQPLTETFRIV